MGMETVMLAIIAGAFLVFGVGVGYADFVANEKAITPEEEQAARLRAVPAKAPALKKAA